MTKLHLGCGKRYIPGFLHVDLGDFPHVDFRRNISDLSIFKDNSIELIYCSHSLEYFDRIQAENSLKEWFRVLQPGGTLRLAVPDFEALAKVYEHYKNLDLIIGPLYGRIVIKTSEGEKVAYHKTCYDFDSLRRLLEKCGYINVKRYEWRETEHKDYDDYSQAYIPHMDKENGMLISLNVEASKPANHSLT